MEDRFVLIKTLPVIDLTGPAAISYTLNQRLFHGLYRRLSANCMALFVRLSLKFESKLDVEKFFGEIILATVSDVWADVENPPRESPIL